MGMVRHRGRLVLFKTDSIYRFNGSNEPEPTVNVGLSSEDGYVTTDTHILFHHERDIYKMSLGDPVSISRPVEKFLRSVTPTNWSSISAGRDDRYAYFYIGDVTINDIFEWDYGKTYSNVVLAYNFLLERWTVYSGWNARVWCRDGYNGYLYFVTTSGDITYVDPSKYNDNGSAIEFQVMWHPIHYGSPRYRKKIDMVSLYGTPGISLRAGESPDKMESFGIYREEAKSVEIRHEIRFNSLWVGASESYKDSPPMIEQLHIGRGFIDAV
jgi:hypothetical protein